MSHSSNPVDPGPLTPECLAILGLAPPVTEEDVKQAFLEKVKTSHPDHGGNAQQFMRLQEAFEQATEYARFKAGRMQWLSSWVEQYAEQQQLVEEIKTLGGSTEIESVDWLAQSIGTDFATVLDRITAVRLIGPQFDDEVISRLAEQWRPLAALRHLELKNSRVTSVGLRQLGGLVSMQHLDLSGTKVNRHTLQSVLRKLDRLQTLVLTNTGIGWLSRLRLRFDNRGLKILN